MSKGDARFNENISSLVRGELSDEERVTRFAQGLDDTPLQNLAADDPRSIALRRQQTEAGDDVISTEAHNPEFTFFQANEELISGERTLFEEEQAAAKDRAAIDVQDASDRSQAKVDHDANLAKIAKDSRRQAILATSISARERLSSQNVSRLASAKGSALGGNSLRSRGISRSGGGVSNFNNISSSVLG